MPKVSNEHDIFLEIGQKRIFAGAVAWPGWCRRGRDEEAATQALLDSGPRYARILQSTNLGFKPPVDVATLHVVERVDGNATTDFGAPDAPLSSDHAPIDDGELRRFETLLRACWAAFDAAIKAAEGKSLRKGPRGGGRDLEAIIDHVRMADEGYLRRIGWKIERFDGETELRLGRMRREILAGLAVAARGELPTVGPRGGKRWTPRFFVRRLAWHVVDHAWEIEDRCE